MPSRTGINVLSDVIVFGQKYKHKTPENARLCVVDFLSNEIKLIKVTLQPSCFLVIKYNRLVIVYHCLKKCCPFLFVIGLIPMTEGMN